MSDTNTVRVGPKGRIVLPVEARRALGIDEGDDLVAVVERGGVTLLTREAALDRFKGLFADVEGSLVDELLADRRTEVDTDR